MKTYYISAIMAGLACLSLYSCEEKNPETPDTPDTPVVPTISISLSEARETAIDFTLTPANAETVSSLADCRDRNHSARCGRDNQLR